MATGLRGKVNKAIDKYGTLLGVKDTGFFVRYLHAGTLPRDQAFYPYVDALFAAADPLFLEILGEIEALAPEFARFGERPGDPKWGAGVFPALDGAAAYAVVQRYRPKRILEIGSGTSTRYLLRAIADMASPCRLTCIDPTPRREIASLGVEHLPRVLAKEDAALLETFEANDIFFIDSSHVMATGTDVDIEFNQLFPSLKPGVLVHVHDIFLPYGYPGKWRDRWYSEQNALIGWLVSGYFEPVFAGHYLSRKYPDEAGRALAKFGATAKAAGSLWLRRSNR